MPDERELLEHLDNLRGSLHEACMAIRLLQRGLRVRTAKLLARASRELTDARVITREAREAAASRRGG